MSFSLPDLASCVRFCVPARCVAPVTDSDNRAIVIAIYIVIAFMRQTKLECRRPHSRNLVRA